MLNFNTPHKKRATLNQGFTLLEVMVALSIIAIVLVSIMRLQGQTIFMNETIRFYTIAPLLAQSKMAEISEDPLAGISDSGDFGTDFSGYTWEAQISDLNIDVPECPEIKLKKVDIIVKLNNDLKFSLRQYMNTDTGSGNE
ncbi:MAG: type II secretion system minor pseudopilin GspI [Dissulfuribacterales bacterium]